MKKKKNIEYLYPKSTEIIYKHRILEKKIYVKFHPGKLSQNVTYIYTYRYSCHFLIQYSNDPYKEDKNVTNAF